MADDSAPPASPHFTRTPFQETFDTWHRALAAPGTSPPYIRTVRASEDRVDAVYRATVDVVAEATADPDTMVDHMQRFADTVQWMAEQDLYALCAMPTTGALCDYTGCLQRVTFVCEGYRSCLYPYNDAVETFANTWCVTTDAMVRAWLRRMLRTHETTLCACVHTAFGEFLSDRRDFVYDTCPPGRGYTHPEAALSLNQWFRAIGPYKTLLKEVFVGQYACSFVAPALPSLLPFVDTARVTLGSMAQVLRRLSRCYDAELEYHTLLHPNAPTSTKICCRRLTRKFDFDGEWEHVRARLLGKTPREGPKTLFYDADLLQAFVDYDRATLDAFGTLLTNIPFRNSHRFNAASCIHLFNLYTCASIRLRAPLLAKDVRETWAFVDAQFQADGPGGCFACNSDAKQMNSVRKWSTGLVSNQLMSMLATRDEKDHPETFTHCLLPWLVAMMEPDNPTLEWSTDRGWWMDLFEVTHWREHLVWQYLEHSLKPRILTGDYTNDDEMDLMVCMSLHFEDVPSRALQHFRTLLAPCTVSPTFDETPVVDSVYLVPSYVWKDDLPFNTRPALETQLQRPLRLTSTAYTDDFVKERRVTWSHWFSTATARLDTEGKAVRVVTAPVYAINLITVLAENDTCAEDDLMEWCIHDPTNTPRECRYVRFWLDYLVQHGVAVVSDAVAEPDPTRPTTTKGAGAATTTRVYTLASWAGTRTLPIPDVPSWARASAVDEAHDEAEGGTATAPALPQRELLVTTKELVESRCVHLLKSLSGTGGIPQKTLVASLRETVKSYVAVSTQDVSEMVDALVRKGYIGRDKTGDLAFATADDVDVD